MTQTKHALLWMIPLLLLTCWLGARSLNVDAVWRDEYNTLDDLGARPTETLRTPLEIWQQIAQNNMRHPPGYFLLVRGWGELVGWTAPALRALSLLAALLGVVWTYRIGRDWVSHRAGLYAAFIVGTAAYYIHFSHELRMYALIAALSAFMLWAYLRLLRRGGNAGGWLVFIAAGVTLIYLHYYAAGVPAAIGLYHLLDGVRRLSRQQTGAAPAGRWWRMLAALALIAGSLLPWVGALFSSVADLSTNMLLRSSALSLSDIVARFFYNFGSGSVIGVALTAVLLLAGALYARQQREARLLWFFTLATFAVLLIIARFSESLGPGRFRYLIALWSLLALLMGAGLVWLEGHLPARPARWLAPVALTVWLVPSLWQTLVTGAIDASGVEYRYPTHRIAAAVRDAAMPTDVVVNFTQRFGRDPRDSSEIDYNSVPVNYIFLADISDRESIPPTWAVFNFALRDDPALALALEQERLWIATNPNDVPALYADSMAQINASFRLCRPIIDQPDLHIDLYAKAAVCCAPGGDAPPPLARYGDMIDLSAEPLPAPVGAVLPVVLAWRLSDKVPPYVYSASLQVLNAAGEKVAQVDYGLLPQTHICQRTLIGIGALPPGTYTLHVTV